MFLKSFVLFLYVSASAFAQVKPQKLSAEVRERLQRVPEFDFIIGEANKLGVKVYLFGGTASAFAHYVRWDLEREAGDDKYQAERFDYDFTNIYRGNQDLDIVVDGTPEQAQQLKKILKERYPHFVGAKEEWEIRLLKEGMGDKLPLLEDQDFKNQHTDSNSTGLLDLTSKKNEIVFRDLLDWDNEESQFLKDVSEAKITYLYNPHHEKTSRFKGGKNPPIFSAIRYLAKLTQYEVEGTKEDLAQVQEIIATTDYSLLSSYVKKKLEEFALKTLLNSPDSEYAWNLLDKTGAREKLIEMDGQRFDQIDSLSWWLNKEPLRSRPFGKEGRSAAEIAKELGLKEIIVSHETRQFLAYENITRSSRGKANAFISRQGVIREAAAYGDGFYTRLGQRGAVGSGLTIRFRLHPEAREGTDFTVHNEYFVVKNKNALTLIQENINIRMVDFLKLFAANKINEKDKGLTEKLVRKYDRAGLDSEEFQEVIRFVRAEFDFREFGFSKEELFDLSLLDDVKSFRELLSLYTTSGDDYFQRIINKKLQTEDSKYWQKNPEVVEKIMATGRIDEKLLAHVFSQPGWEHRSDLVQKIIDKGSAPNYVIPFVLKKTHWPRYKEWVELYIDKKDYDWQIGRFILTDPFSSQYEEWMEVLLNRESLSADVIMALSLEHWSHREDLIEQVILDKKSIKNKEVGSKIIEHFLSQEKWGSKPGFIEKYIFAEENIYAQDIAAFVLSQPWSKDHPQWLDKIQRSGEAGMHILEFVLSQKHWEHKSSLVDHFLNMDVQAFDILIVKHILTQEHWSHRTDWVDILLERGKVDRDLVNEVIGLRNSDKQNEWIDKVIENGKASLEVVDLISDMKPSPQVEKWVEALVKNPLSVATEKVLKKILSRRDWVHRADLIQRILNNPIHGKNYIQSFMQFIFSKEHWFNKEGWFDYWLDKGEASRLAQYVLSQEHSVSKPELVEKLIKGGVSDREIISSILSREFWFHRTDWVEQYVDRNDKTIDAYIVQGLLTREDFPNRLNLIKKIASRNNYNSVSIMLRAIFNQSYHIEYEKIINNMIKDRKYTVDIVLSILSQNHWKHKFSDWIKIVFQSRDLREPLSKLRNFVFSQEFTAEFPEIFVEFILEAKRLNIDLAELNKFSHWRSHPVFMDYLSLKNKAVTVSMLIERNKKIKFTDWYETRVKSQTSFQCHQIL